LLLTATIYQGTVHHHSRQSLDAIVVQFLLRRQSDVLSADILNLHLAGLAGHLLHQRHCLVTAGTTGDEDFYLSLCHRFTLNAGSSLNLEPDFKVKGPEGFVTSYQKVNAPQCEWHDHPDHEPKTPDDTPVFHPVTSPHPPK